MQINGLLRSTAPSAVSSGGDTVASATGGSGSGSSGPPQKVSSTFREILSRFDMKNISPREFTEMIQSLHSSGAITEEQYRELSLIRLELDEAKVDPNEQIDLLDFYGQRMAEQQKEFERLAKRAERNPEIATNLESSLSGMTRRLEWVQKFAAINTRTDVGSLDAMA